MADSSDKSENGGEPGAEAASAKLKAKARRRVARVKKGADGAGASLAEEKAAPAAQGYDPELLFVECGRCGSPVLWEDGRASRLLLEAGIDPLELDSSCLLLTDGCPACGSSREYSVRIFRLSEQGATQIAPLHGHA